MTNHTASRSSSASGRAVVVEVRRAERGCHEVVLDAQFDADPFLITLRRRSNEVPDLSPGDLVAVRRLSSGEIVVTPSGTGVPGGVEPV